MMTTCTAHRKEPAPHPADQTVVGQAMSTSRQKLESMRAGLADQEDAIGFGKIFAAEIAEVEKSQAALREAVDTMPIRDEFLLATAPMAFGRFADARDNLLSYRKKHADDRLAGFTLALCHIEVRGFAAAQSVLRDSFPDDARYPAVRLLRLTCDYVTEHGGGTEDERVVEAFDWAAARIRCERAEMPGGAAIFANPLLGDAVLLRFLGLAELEASPIWPSAGRLFASVDEVGTTWANMVVCHMLLHSEFDQYFEPDEDDAVNVEGEGALTADERMVKLLVDWYGPDEAYEKDSPERRAALVELRRLNPENGLWKLLEIPYDDETTDDEDVHMWYKPLTADELQNLQTAAGHDVIELAPPDWAGAGEAVRRRANYPYAGLFHRATRAPFNMAPHVGNVLQRAQSTVHHFMRDRREASAHSAAQPIAKFVQRLKVDDQSMEGALTRDGWDSTASEVGVFVAAYDGDLQAALEATARLEMEHAALVEFGVCIGVLDALPLSLFEEVARGQWSGRALHRRAKVVMEVCPSDTARARERLSNEYLAARTVPKTLLSENEELITTLLAHVDQYDEESQWRAAWALGRMDRPEAAEKLRELAKSDRRTVRVMANAALESKGRK